MKKIIALAAALCFALLFCLAPAGSEAEAAKELTLKDYRYRFEHMQIPVWLWRLKGEAIDNFEKNGVYAYWESFINKYNYDVTYSPLDYDVRSLPQEDGTRVVVLSMPKPVNMTECYRIYLCYNPDTDKTGIFTIEYNNLFKELCYLCEWVKEGVHNNYGECELFDRNDPDYESKLAAEAEKVLEFMRKK